ncbi:hypothetical protein SADUNF_Sadunf12G0038600 [Salix dunnii]|uniref:Uncharacterized protein n=1 Tax=Salix dunnii TaxID=1413687 RepID=A0A835JMW5_9ROSI|nr:hypothetical protein SADUNF_Sadunf12G0038600 [Salix dunnii]
MLKEDGLHRAPLVFREPNATVIPQGSQMGQLEIERKDESSRSQFQRTKPNSEHVSTSELAPWSPSCIELEGKSTPCRCHRPLIISL